MKKYEFGEYIYLPREFFEDAGGFPIPGGLFRNFTGCEKWG